MDRRKEAGTSREGLLGSHHQAESIPLRKSLEDAYNDESSDDELDVTEYLVQDQTKAPARGFDAPRRLTDLRRILGRRTKCLLTVFVVLAIFWAIMGGGGFWLYKKAPLNGQSPPWYPTPLGGTVVQWSESYKKAAELVKHMSLTEKVNITTGTGWQMGLSVGNSAPAVHVGFPGLAYQDGPLGLRFADNATAFPAGITVGATWNKDLMYKRGKGHGLEARLKGINVLLGPCVGPLGRMPAGGRNWEVSENHLEPFV